MGITNSNKVISTETIDCKGTLKISLSLAAAPDITSNPADIVLALDCSGSMRGEPFTSLRKGASAFIDIIDEASDGTLDGTIGSGSRIGIVGFSGTAFVSAPLDTSAETLKTALDQLTANGSTNHADAFTTAAQMFDSASSNAKIIVMFTDGKTTAGPLPSPAAAAARDMGIVIYCIGLTGADGIDVQILNEWATDPDTSHVAVTPNDADLEQLFADLARNITKTGATEIVIDERIHPDFTITDLIPPTKGDAVLLSPSSLQWKIAELGVSGNEGALLEFHVRHNGNASGTVHVNQSILYTDAENNAVVFPDPTVTVDCGVIIHPEPCPTPVELTVDGCRDSVVMDLGDIISGSSGRILQLNLTLKKVCPDRRVALAVILTEVDQNGTEHPRGMKTFTVPAHHFPECRDILLRCISFVLPDDLKITDGETGSLCSTRNLKVRFLANNIDTDYHCCDADLTF